MTLDLSCPDWEHRLRAGLPPMPDLALYTERGARAVLALNRLRLADVHGTPTFEEAGGDWFRAVVAVLFGSLDPVTKQRLIRELFLLVPKKNSKTTNGALLMLVALLLNERPRASFLMTAPVQDTAEMAFSAVAGAIQLDPVLDRKFHIRGHKKTIVHRETKAELEILTFDPAVVTGRKVSGGALIDELHEIAKMAKAAKALRQLRGGMLPFPEAFLAFITTQSDGPPVGVFRDELAKARDIRDGKRRGPMLPVLYELPIALQSDPDEPWRDPVHWPMVTPNVGRSVTMERLIEDFDTAAATSTEELRAWASQHLNLEIGIALSADSWAGALFWEQCADVRLRSLDELLERSEVVVVGIDGGGLDDLLGVAVVGREIDTGNWLHWGHAWMHPVALERRRQNESAYRDFEEDGDLTIVEKVGDDVAAVAAIVKKCEDAGLLAEDKAVGADQVGLGSIPEAIEAAGVAGERIVGISQGWKMVGAINTAERALAGGTLIHGGTRIGAWSVGNAKPERVGNATKITKERAGSAKIDWLLALLNAITLIALNPESRRHSYAITFV